MFDMIDMIVSCGVAFVLGAVIATAALYVMYFQHREYTESDDYYDVDYEPLYDYEDYK